MERENTLEGWRRKKLQLLLEKSPTSRRADHMNKVQAVEKLKHDKTLKLDNIQARFKKELHNFFFFLIWEVMSENWIPCNSIPSPQERRFAITIAV